MQIYAVVPARSGSKGLPNKNIINIHGKPLLAYSIAFAKKLQLINRIFCSTDSPKYASIALEYGAEVPFLRSVLASDDNAMEEDILEDMRLKFIENTIPEPDLMVWLRPTFIFRDINDVSSCIRALKSDSSLSAARTVVQAENRLYKIKNNHLVPSFDDLNKSMIRRQDMPCEYTVFSTDVFRFKGNDLGPDFLGRSIHAVETNPICGLDIDNVFDLEIVRNIIENSRELLDEYM